MLIRVVEFIYLITATRGTLLFSRIHPSVIKLQGDGFRSGESFHDASFLNVKFNEKQDFSCLMGDNIITNQVTAPISVKPFEGACWSVATGNPKDVSYRVCAGNVIYSISSSNMQKVVATSNKTASVDVNTGAIKEPFNTGVNTIDVLYKCHYAQSGISEVEASTEGRIRKLIVESFVFCEHSTSDLFVRHISAIPTLSLFVDEPGYPAFWEYKFTYPSTATQEHTDPTGKTRNESYTLGRSSSVSSDLFTIRFTDVDIDAGDPYITSSLQYPLIKGDVCDRYNISRTVDVSYVCPLEWEELEIEPSSGGWVPYTVVGIGSKQFFSRIRQVDETRLCHYEFVIDATSLCIYKQFRPRYVSMEHPRTIRCYPN